MTKDENYTNWYNAYMKGLADLPVLLTRLRPSQEHLRQGLQERLEALWPAMSALTMDEFEKTVLRPAAGSTVRLYKTLSEEIRQAADPYVEMADCREGVLYRVRCRNSNCGIWIPRKRGFEIARTKFERTYLFVEDHWDSGPTFGTAKPYEVLETLPVFKDDNDKLAYLLRWREKLGPY